MSEPVRSGLRDAPPVTTVFRVFGIQPGALRFPDSSVARQLAGWRYRDGVLPRTALSTTAQVIELPVRLTSIPWFRRSR